jgi:glycosyltransferase involved in cell wall biosynthesis
MKARSTRPARIAFVSDAVWPYHTGGKETRLWEITRRLAAAGHRVDVYTMQWWDGGSTVRHDGVTYHALCPKLPLYRGHRRSILQAVVFGLATLKLLVRPFDAVDVDHMPFFPLFSARLVCMLRRKPLVATWHEVWGPEYWQQYLGVGGLVGGVTEKLALRMPDVIVSNSSQTTERLLSVRPDVAVETVPLGVDRERIAAIEPVARRAEVVYAGRLLAHKNVDVLLRALAVLHDGGRPVRGLIIGEGPERVRLEELAVSLGLGGMVEFCDFLPDHDDLLATVKSAQAFVLPSEREGFGIVVLEANACGLPVVTIDHPDNAARLLITEGRNGYLSPLDPACLADRIGQCLDDGELDSVAIAASIPAELEWSAIADRVGAVLVGAGTGRTSSGN